jgi:hypothetical protein
MAAASGWSRLANLAAGAELVKVGQADGLPPCGTDDGRGKATIVALPAFHATSIGVTSCVISFPRPRSLGLPSVLLAIIALAMQIAVAAIVPFAAQAGSLDRLVATSICHSESGGDQGPGPVRHQSPDCAICPLCQAIGHPAPFLATPIATLIVPARVVVAVLALPPARAPPSVGGSAASARGPPPTI